MENMKYECRQYLSAMTTLEKNDTKPITLSVAVGQQSMMISKPIYHPKRLLCLSMCMLSLSPQLPKRPHSRGKCNLSMTNAYFGNFICGK